MKILILISILCSSFYPRLALAENLKASDIEVLRQELMDLDKKMLKQSTSYQYPQANADTASNTGASEQKFVDLDSIFGADEDKTQQKQPKRFRR